MRRRSLLQKKITIFLAFTTYRSLTKLAADLKHLRPAVSRACHSLKKQGILFFDGSYWLATKRGKVEAKHYLEDLRTTRRQTQWKAGQIKFFLADLAAFGLPKGEVDDTEPA